MVHQLFMLRLPTFVHEQLSSYVQQPRHFLPQVGAKYSSAAALRGHTNVLDTAAQVFSGKGLIQIACLLLRQVVPVKGMDYTRFCMQVDHITSCSSWISWTVQVSNLIANTTVASSEVLDSASASYRFCRRGCRQKAEQTKFVNSLRGKECIRAVQSHRPQKNEAWRFLIQPRLLQLDKPLSES